MKGVVGGLVRVQEPNDGTTKTPRKKSKLDALRETWATWVFRMASLTTLNPRICMLEHHRLAGLLSRIFEPTVVGGTAVTAGKAIPSDMLRFLSVCLR